MVLPEKLVGFGLGLSSMLSPTDAVSHKALKLRDLNDLAGSSTTDLVRFSGTLKVARGIVEEHRRSEIIEVPTSGLVSILDRIKALEKEVQDLIDGKGVSENSKAIGSPASGSASGGHAPSSPSAASSGGSSSDGGGSGSSSGSNAGSSSSGSGSSNSKSVSNTGGSSGSDYSGSGSSGSGSGPPSKDSPSGSTPSGSSPSATSPDTGSSGGSSDSKDDCAPEHLLYRLGGASLQRRSMTSVSAHPLFRRTTNCTLDSVSGGGKNKSTALPSGAAVFKESSPSSGADGSTDGPAADPSASVTSPPPAATTGPGSKVKGNPESNEKDATVTTTMTSTSYSTVTVRLSLSASTKAGLHGKYLNTTGIPDRLSSASQLFSNVTTALATESEATTPTSTALSGKSRFAQSNATAAIDAASASPSSLVGDESSSPVAPSSDSTTPLSTGDIDLTAANSSATAANSPTISDVNSKALLAPNQQNLTLPSAAAADTPAAETTSSILSPEPSPQSLAESNNTTATVAPSAGSPISELSSASSLQDDISSLASTNSSGVVAPENAAVPGPSAKTTSTITSTVSITVPAGQSTIGADADPEATTATAPLAPPVNGTLEKRQSGFRTERSLRRKTAAADDRR